MEIFFEEKQRVKARKLGYKIKDITLVGFKGQTYIDIGYVYTPHVPLATDTYIHRRKTK